MKKKPEKKPAAKKSAARKGTDKRAFNALLRHVYRDAYDAIMLMDGEIFIDCNRKTLEMFRCGRNDFIGKPPYDFSPPAQPDGSDSRKKAQRMIRRALKRGPHMFEWTHRRADGELFSAEVVLQAHEYGGRPYIQATVRDVTAEKDFENLILREKEKFEKTFNSTPAISAISDIATGRFIEINEAFVQFSGYSRGEIIGRTSYDLGLWMSPADRERIISEMKASGRVMHVELDMRVRSGEVRNLIFSIDSFTSGESRYLITTAVDITERKRAEMKLVASDERYRALFEGAAEGILVADIETQRFLHANPAICKLLGYGEGELAGKSLADIHPPEHLDRVIEEFKRLARGEIRTAEYIPCLRKDGMVFYADITTSQTMLDGRMCNVGFFTEVTSRMEAEEEIRKLAEVVRYSGELVCITTPDEKMIYLNDAGRAMLGLDPERVRDISIADVFPGNLADRVRTKLLPALIKKGTLEGDLQYRNLRTGQIIDVHTMAFVIRDQRTGDIRYLANISRDITDRKMAEQIIQRKNEELEAANEELQAALEELDASHEELTGAFHEIQVSEDKYRALFNEMMNGFVVFEMLLDESGNAFDYKYIMMNPSFERISGIKRSEIMGISVRTMFPGREPYMLQELNAILRDGKPFQGTIYMEMISKYFKVYVYRQDRTHVAAIFEDVTESTRAENLLEIQRDLAIALTATDSMDSALETVLQATLRIEGFDSGGIYLVNRDGGVDLAVTGGLTDSFIGSVSHYGPESPNALIIRKGEPIYTTYTEITSRITDAIPGEQLLGEGIRAIAVVPFMHHGEVIGCMNIASHKTDIIPGFSRHAVESIASQVGAAIARFRVEQQIRESLAEKEMLLKEVHHRVKNNMQVISSLIQLQAERMVDPLDRVLMDGVKSSVRSMALIHEKLYRSENFSRVDMAGYLRGLADEILRFNPAAGRVKASIEVGEVSLSIDEAIPCGLIINELMTNSLKHAFPRGRTGLIRIRLALQPDGKRVLSVVDNGAGMPETIDYHRPSSLGLQLVDALVGQLTGKIEVRRNGGTSIIIEF